jgi:hypothetical protein
MAKTTFCSLSRYFKKGAFLCPLLAFGCAGQRPPEGGPVDTTPPEIISVYPSPNTTNYADSRVALEFSKYVDRRSVEESIFISPYVKDVEFNWSGREVEMSFREPLRENTTYVVTIGTDVLDTNNRNRMAHAFSLAFSTGTQIDRGEIRGRVFDEKPSGVMIFAYRLDDLNADTLNPMTQKPDYITQAGSAGDYSLSHLTFGLYRIIALRDEFRNLLYDPETDAMSTAPGDIGLDERDSLRSELNFQLTTEDTTAPRLIFAAATDVRHVDLTFSEDIESAEVLPEAFTISDTLQSRRLGVKNVFLHLENPAVVTLVTEQQQKDSLYRIFVGKVKDRTGHIVNPLASSKQFTGTAQPDTLPPRLLFTTAGDSTIHFSVNEQFRFDFSDALQRQSVDGGVQLRGRDSVEISHSTTWSTAASFTVRPQQPLRPDYFYTFFVRFDSLRDEVGNRWKDSTRKFSFRTVDPEKVSSIEGTFFDEDTSLVDRYVIIAQNDIDKSTRPVHVNAKRGGKFIFPQLGQGEYRLKAFQDLNSTGIYNSGKPFPFVPAERFAVYRDSVKVRARWPVEDVLIKMK